ncbi:hypothetical protein V2A60_006897 [Cordyceps javanica]|uniref:Uncharacterized protein n=1 Tax=Cordyceps javanica TaxID=43265 RepID=A0A545VKH1_9HYPO|nr:hypothetical protein IF1G_10638 [Cordyceps javanica]TQW02231.1 hypothetical protein IF2G_10239 [Cordyceps javanica]
MSPVMQTILALLAVATSTASAKPVVAAAAEEAPASTTACVYTENRWPGYTWGPTSTTWTSTVTATNTVDCGGCDSAEYHDQYMGPGPVVFFTTTVTAETASTTTVMECGATPTDAA